MKVELNIDKSPFRTIGPYHFTYDEISHDIDVATLDEETRKQLLYNLRMGVVKTEDREEMIQLADIPTQTSDLIPAVSVPILEADVTKNMESIIAKNRRILKKILLGTIPSVKKEAATMRLGNVRKLMELETEGKNRKKLISFFESRLEAHTTEVAEAKGSEDLDANDMVKAAELSTQLTDVVVSEEEMIAIPQEVLNHIM